MLRVNCFTLLIAAMLVLMTAVAAMADPGKITKYVYPDGRVVYSDKPVPGATAVAEIVTPPSKTPPASSPAKETAAAAAPRSALDLSGLPEGMTQSQAINRMLGAAIGFATDRAPAWQHNTWLYLYWREGRAEITQDCFLGDGGACLYEDMTDKALILTVLEACKGAESGDASLQQWVEDDPSNVPYAAFFAGQVLARNIIETYRQAAEILRREDPALGATGPSPRLVVAFVAATGRRLRDMERQDSSGWGFDDVLGWRVIYRPSGVPQAENMAIWFADTKIPFREAPAR